MTGYILLLLLALLAPPGLSQPLLSSPAYGNINATANYTLNLTVDTQAYDPNGYFLLTLPSLFNQSSSLSNVSCSPSCTITNLTLNFTTMPSITNGVVQVNIVNITNPIIPSQPVFFFQMYNSSGFLSQVWNSPAMTIETYSLMCFGSSVNPTVDTYGTLNLSVYPTSPVVQGGFFLINIPQYWSGEPSFQVLNSMTPTCTVQNVTTNCTINSTTNQILLPNSLNLPQFEPVQLTISNFLSQPSAGLFMQVYVAITDNNMNYINFPNPCPLNPSQPVILTTTLNDTSPLSTTGPNLLSLTISSAINFYPGDVVEYRFPTSVTLNSTAWVFVMNTTINSNFVQFGNSNTDSGSDGVSQSLFVPTTNDSPFKNTVFPLTILLNIPPLSTNSSSVSGMLVNFYRNGYIYATGFVNFQSTAVIGQLSPTITPLTLVGNSNASVLITFTTITQLNQTYSINVIIPNNITQSANPPNCNLAYMQTLGTNVNCSYSNNLLTVNLTASTTTVSAGTQLGVQIFNIQNLYSAQPAMLEIYTSNQAVNATAIDQGIVGLIALPTNFSISYMGIVGGGTPAAGSSNNYIFQFTFPAIGVNATNNCFILLNLPSGWSAPANISATSPTITLGATSINSTTPYNSFYPTNIVIGLGTNIFTSNQTLNITLTSLIAPSTTSTSQAFLAVLYNASNPMSFPYIESISNSTVWVPIVIQPSSSPLTITSSQPVYGSQTVLTFSLNVTVTQPVNATIIVNLPPYYQLATGVSVSTCAINGTSAPCIYQNSSVNVTVPQPLTSGSAYSLTISGFTSPLTAPLSQGVFVVSSFYQNWTLSSNTIASPISMNYTTSVSNLSVTVINPTQSYYSSSQTLQIIITTPTPVQPNTIYAIINLPGYTYNGTSPVPPSLCPQSPNTTCTQIGSNPAQINVTSTNTTNTSSLNVILDYFISPAAPPSPNQLMQVSQTTPSYLTVWVYDDNNQALFYTNTASVQVPFSTSCNFPCQTCSPSNRSSCNTCYSSSQSQQYLLYNSTCVASCPSTTLLQNATCVTSCGTGFYQSGINCLLCSSASSSAASVYYCLSCLNQSFLTSTSLCVVTCPTGQTGVNGLCTLCQAPCSNCFNQITNCTSCIGGYTYNPVNHLCNLQCPFGYKPDGSCNKDPYSSMVIPLPFSIVALAIIIFSIITHFQTGKITHWASMAMPLIGILELGVAVTVIATTLTVGFQNKSPTEIGLDILYAGLGFTVFMNIVMMVFFEKRIGSDLAYERWRGERSQNKCSSYACLFLTLFDMKFVYFQFSKAFKAVRLNAPLSDTGKFKTIDYLAYFSVFPTAAIIAGCVIIMMNYYHSMKAFVYVECIDCIVVKCIGILLMAVNACRPGIYFSVIVGPGQSYLDGNMSTDRSRALNNEVELKEGNNSARRANRNNQDI